MWTELQEYKVLNVLLFKQYGNKKALNNFDWALHFKKSVLFTSEGMPRFSLILFVKSLHKSHRSSVSLLCVLFSFQIVDSHIPDRKIDIQLCILSLVPALILLGQVRDLKYMVPFSMLANIFMMSGFAITLYYIFSSSKLQSFENNKLFSSVEQLPRFFATVIFAIEGIGVVSSNANHSDD